jgi:hypothetical protein
MAAPELGAPAEPTEIELVELPVGVAELIRELAELNERQAVLSNALGPSCCAWCRSGLTTSSPS